MRVITGLSFMCFLFLMHSLALAEDGLSAGTDLASLSLEELNRRVENPLTDIWSLTLQENLSLLEGDAIDGKEFQNLLFFQPFMPFPVGRDDSWMFTLRPVFPLVTNPVLDPAEPDGTTGHKTGFGDMQLLALAGPNRSDGIVWGAGATFKFPTATDDALGADVWQAGPSAMLFHMGKPWVLGLLGQHWWSVAGDSDADSVSRTDIQYVLRRQLPGGWSVGMGPTVTIDWKAPSGEKVTFPVGLGVTRTVRWNGTPWKLRIEPQYSIIRPDELGVEWNLRIQVAPIINNPFD